MTYSEALDFIHSRPRVKNTGDHSAMLYLLDSLGNPQDKLKYIHISGTNGKGSCTAMCANILKCAGYKTGMNISPYVIDFRERIQINGEYISKKDLLDIVEKVKPTVEKLDNENKIISEFALVTAIAFTYFSKENVDVVCLEVGMGGKNDCTNIIKNNLCACIMNIAFDHTRILGDTLSDIAQHKAGIIKDNCPTVVYPAMEKEALNVIKDVCKAKNSILNIPDISRLSVKNTGFLKSQMKYKNLAICQSFCGLHQSYNAMTVIEAMNCLRKQGYAISDEDIVKGIETTEFPRRIELISENPLIILDGGHNIDGITALTNVLKENSIYDVSCIWASLSDKEPEKIAELLSPYVSKLYTIKIEDNKRALSSDRLSQMAKKYIDNVITAKNVKEAIDMAIEEKDEKILICGSLYLASEAREYLMKLKEVL